MSTNNTTEKTAPRMGITPLPEDHGDYDPARAQSPAELLAFVRDEGARKQYRHVAASLIRDGISFEDVKIDGRDVVAGDRRVTFDDERQARRRAFLLLVAMLDVGSRMLLDRHARRLGL